MTHDQFLAMRRFPALDGLRGVAAGMVIFFHFGGPAWVWLNGWVGVHIFFVLSGFLITTLALREVARSGRLSIKNFYIRRATRIMPVYYVVLAVVAAASWLRGEYGDGLARLMPYYLTFNGEFFGPGQPHGHVWTLGIEQKFYLVWPVLGFSVGMTIARRAALTSALLTVLVALCVVDELFPSYVSIAVGCLLAVVLHSRRGFEALAALTRPVLATVTGVVFVAGHLAIPVGTGFFGSYRPVIVVYALLVALLLVSLVGHSPLGWLLSRRAMTFIGGRSYSVYLLQGLAALAVSMTIPLLGTQRTAAAVVVMVVAILMADVLYRWVELPFISLGRRWVGGRANGVPASALRPSGVVTV